jgi:hypothetical protein
VTVYSYAQLEQLWINAGGDRSLAPLAAAIAEAESGGRSDAVNATDNNGTQTSWGLWQISDGTHNQPVPGILSPAVNAREAVAKYHGAGNTFNPWGTYASGAYRAFLSGSTTPDPNVPAAAPGSGGGGGGASAATTAAAGTCLVSLPVTGCLLSKSQARALIGGSLMVAGGILALAGLAILVAAGLAGTGAGRAVTQAAGTVAPAGRVVKLARRAVP